MKPITESFFVSEQIHPEDIPALAEAGVSHLICNRPDHEADEQPLSETLQEVAQQHGMSFTFLPIAPGQFHDADVAKFKDAIASTGNTLAFCRTGTRSLSLWVLANPDQMTASELLQLSEAAGYNMTALIDRVAQ